jgi:hypothetical protein
MNNDTNDKDLRDFFQQRFENESIEPPREAWVFVKSNLVLKTNWWKLGFYYFSGALFVAVTSFFIYNYSVQNKSKIAKNEKSKKEINKINKSNEIISNDSTFNQIIENKVVNEKKQNTSQVYQNDEDQKFEGSKTDVKSTNSNSNTKKEQKTIIPSNSQKVNLNKNKFEKQTSKKHKSKDKILENSYIPDIKQNNSKETFNQTIENSGNKIKENNVTTKEELGLKVDKKEDISESTAETKVKGTSENETKNSEQKVPEINKDSLQTVSTPIHDTIKPSHIDSVKNLNVDRVNKTDKLKSKWTMDLYFGLGRNTRVIVGTFDGNNLVNLDFSDRRFKMKNKTFGLNVNYALSSYFSIQTGLNAGGSRAQSKFFQKKLVKKTNSDYEFNTAEGELRIATSDLENYYQNSDTVQLKIRFNHKSSYFSIPLSCKLSVPNKFISPYLRLGSSFDFELNRKTSVDIVRNEETQTFPITKSNHKLGRSIQGLIGFGLSTNTKMGLNLFIEQQYSIALTPYIIRPNYRVRNNYGQIRFGLSYNF